MITVQVEIHNILASFIHTVERLEPAVWEVFYESVQAVENIVEEKLAYSAHQYNQKHPDHPIILNGPKPNPMQTTHYSANYSVFV